MCECYYPGLDSILGDVPLAVVSRNKEIDTAKATAIVLDFQDGTGQQDIQDLLTAIVQLLAASADGTLEPEETAPADSKPFSISLNIDLTEVEYNRLTRIAKYHRRTPEGHAEWLVIDAIRREWMMDTDPNLSGRPVFDHDFIYK